MSPVRFPDGFTIEGLRREHPRKHFRCGQPSVDDWLKSKALQHQHKHLSTTKVLLSGAVIAGYYTLATSQVHFGDLPAETVKNLPRRHLPVAVLAWLGVHLDFQRQGLGQRLLAQALRDCYEASRVFAFIAVLVDALDDSSRAFYQQWDFAQLPGHPYRLFLTAAQLDLLMKED